jgi:uncharacterized protein YkwD
MSETCLNGHNRAMRKFVALAAIAVIAGCGGGGDNEKGSTPAKVTPNSGGGVVSADATKGILGPAVDVENGAESVITKGGGAISPKENQPTDAQRNGVAAAGACASTSANPSSSNLRAMSSAIRCLLNAERAAKGLPALHSNGKLKRAAAAWARAMVARRFFAHEAGRSTVQSRIKKTGYIRGNWSLGENIAWGSGALATPQAIVNGWMHSPGHRANILRGQFKDIGIGIRLGAPGQGLSGGATYVTDFGRHG